MSGNVGAGVMNIITESLYDKPIVVFREYVQNSVDSFIKAIDNGNDKEQFNSKIWLKNNNLFFLDNGVGISENEFEDRMKKIAFSKKDRYINIGYKGIGRLSGLSYCKKLIFINIISYSNNIFQKYIISADKFQEIKNTAAYSEMDYSELMDKISEYEQVVDKEEIKELLTNVEKNYFVLDTGFLVVLENVNTVLNNIIEHKNFNTELGWLLPVNFKRELFETEKKQLFFDLTEKNEEGIIPVVGYNIYYNDVLIERPISEDMLRDFMCKNNFGYAVGMHSFNSNKIRIDKKNEFSGIRIYLDNVLLCDETELIENLKKLGLILHTTNELVQTVRGIGAMIYITDKVNILANARRTFIEIVDEDSLDFLKKLAEFIEKIYNARYTLSKYAAKKDEGDRNTSKLNELRNKAVDALNNLSEEYIEIEESEVVQFEDKSDIEKKQLLKKVIDKEIRADINSYLSQITVYDHQHAYENFKTWLLSN